MENSGINSFINEIGDKVDSMLGGNDTETY